MPEIALLTIVRIIGGLYSVLQIRTVSPRVKPTSGFTLLSGFLLHAHKMDALPETPGGSTV
jgi:hypothetical protein